MDTSVAIVCAIGAVLGTRLALVSDVVGRHVSKLSSDCLQGIADGRIQTVDELNHVYEGFDASLSAYVGRLVDLRKWTYAQFFPEAKG